MKIKAGLKKQRLIFTFLATYILMLFIPILVGSLAYGEALGMIEESVIQSKLSMLDQTRDILDSRLNEIENMALQLALNPKTRMLSEAVGSPDDKLYDDIREYTKLLNNYWLINDNSILDFFVFFKDIDLVVTSRTFFKLSNFYGEFFKYKDMDFDEFSIEILERNYNNFYIPATSVELRNKSYFSNVQAEAVVYLQSIPIGYSGQNNATILVLINNKEINKLLGDIIPDNSGSINIINKNGSIITGITHGTQGNDIPDASFENTSGHEEIDMPGGKMMITYTTSEKRKWKYVLAIPSTIFLTKVIYIRKITWGIVLATLFIEIIAAFFFAYRNTKPINRVIKSLGDFLGGEFGNASSEYKLLQTGIGKIIDSNVHLQDAMKKQMPLMVIAFFNRLFRGDFNSMEEIEAVLSSIGLEVNSRTFAVVIIRIIGYGESVSREIFKELQMKKVVLKNALIPMLQNKGFLHDVDENKIALLYNADYSGDNETDMEECVKIEIKRIHQYILDHTDISISLALGGICDSLTDAWRHFNEANRLLDGYRIEKENMVIWYDRTQEKSEIYDYGMDVEQKLMNFIRSGDENSMHLLLDGLYRRNFLEKSLSARMKKRLIDEMSGTWLKIALQLHFDMDADNRMEDIDLYETLEEYYNKIVKAYTDICRSVKNQMKSHNTVLKEKIIEYINSVYMQADLNLYSVSSRFHLSETYLSQFFKEQTGENFACYLERVRMQCACRLLPDNSISIYDIAIQAGYHSDHVFRRAFKRITGISPTEYRNAGIVPDQKNSLHS